MFAKNVGFLVKRVDCRPFYFVTRPFLLWNNEINLWQYSDGSITISKIDLVTSYGCSYIITNLDILSRCILKVARDIDLWHLWQIFQKYGSSRLFVSKCHINVLTLMCLFELNSFLILRFLSSCSFPNISFFYL